MAAPKKSASAPAREQDVDQFCADVLDFAGDGIYPRFLSYMAERGYTEPEVEKLTEQANARAGRS